MTRDRADKLLETARRHFIPNYKPQPIVLARGEGVHVWDVQGHRYLDMTAGIAVCVLGHAHPKLTAAIAGQAARLLHVSNLFYNETQILLAEALCQRSFARRVFFCNSGAEANEAALKLARRYQQVVARRHERVTIVATDGSFHGRTMATVAATGQEKYRVNFGPLVEPVRFVPYGDLETAKRILSEGHACAFLVEPIQAEGGIVSPPKGYLAGLQDACRAAGAILIVDEVQTGVGRTGSWFAYEQEGFTPDVMTLAKGLAGGVPIGAVLTNDELAQGLAPLPGEPAPHASTFGGNPLACAAALAVLDVIESEALLDNCRQAGEYLGRGLQKLVDKHPKLAVEARGRGLLRGVRVTRDAAAIVTRCREKGVLLSLAGSDVVRFAPPLIVRRDDLDAALKILGEVLAEREATSP